MQNGTILIAVSKDTSLGELTRQIENIRAIPARVSILVVGEMPQFPYYAVGVASYGAVVIPPEWQEAVAANNAALKAKAEEVETLLQQHDVSGDVTTVACDPYAMSESIAEHAMLSDIALVGGELRATDTLFRQVVHGVLFQSPIGVLLNDTATTTLNNPNKVFVAWKPQKHASRAVHQALPLLRQAKEVVVGIVDPQMTEFRDGEDPGVDVAKWLTHHGCNVVVRQYPSGGQEIGECILDRSKEYGADLIVVGAYSHSRTREAIFGGTTRTLIEQSEQAVFLAH